MQTIKPANKQVFAKPDEAETVTSSGFILTEQAAYKPKTAEVINIGEDVKSCKPHDKIVYKVYATTDVKLNDEDYILIADDDILGVVLDV